MTIHRTVIQHKCIVERISITCDHRYWPCVLQKHSAAAPYCMVVWYIEYILHNTILSAILLLGSHEDCTKTQNRNIEIHSRTLAHMYIYVHYTVHVYFSQMYAACTHAHTHSCGCFQMVVVGLFSFNHFNALLCVTLFSSLAPHM